MYTKQLYLYRLYCNCQRAKHRRRRPRLSSVECVLQREVYGARCVYIFGCCAEPCGGHCWCAVRAQPASTTTTMNRCVSKPSATPLTVHLTTQPLLCSLTCFGNNYNVGHDMTSTFRRSAVIHIPFFFRFVILAIILKCGFLQVTCASSSNIVVFVLY